MMKLYVVFASNIVYELKDISIDQAAGFVEVYPDVHVFATNVEGF